MSKPRYAVDVDGFYYVDLSAGMYTSHNLRSIAEELDRLNSFIQVQVADDLESYEPKTLAAGFNPDGTLRPIEKKPKSSPAPTNRK